MKVNMKKTIVMMVIFSFLVSKIPVLAHEIYYETNGSPIYLKWGNLENGFPYLKINGDYLSLPYSLYYNNAVQAWGNSSTEVTTVSSSFNTSTVDVLTPTQDYWLERYGEIRINLYLAVTDTKDSGGSYIEDIDDARNSTGSLVYAQIYMTPYMSNFESNYDYMEKTMVHELGHVLGLGHPDDIYYVLDESVPSIMRRGYSGYKTPQTHDIGDLERKY